MRNPISLCLFLIPLFSILFSINVLTVSGKCLNDQKSLLLQFRAELKYDASLSTTLVNWNPNVDCCNWNGVECDNGGHVIGLNLNSESISGGLDDSSNLFSLRYLQTLDLSNNRFSGQIELSKFGTFKELQILDLSYNKLSISARSSGSPSLSLPQFFNLRLISCNIKEFPDLKNQSRMTGLDLSHNRISGEIPNYMWEVSPLQYLNLSSNQFSSLQEPYRFPSSLGILDLHSNQLQGSIPKPPKRVIILDYSSNNFGSSIPADIGSYLAVTVFFSIANNKLTGVIPQSIGDGLQIGNLNLSNNSLEGPIPLTIGRLKRLDSLDLSSNKLSGYIPVQLANLQSISFLNLSNNQLVGEIPQRFQLQKFSEKSFEGNKGLCGPPLKKSCDAAAEAHGPSSILDWKESEWYTKHADLLFPEMLD